MGTNNHTIQLEYRGEIVRSNCYTTKSEMNKIINHWKAIYAKSLKKAKVINDGMPLIKEEQEPTKEIIKVKSEYSNKQHFQDW